MYSSVSQARANSKDRQESCIIFLSERSCSTLKLDIPKIQNISPTFVPVQTTSGAGGP